MTFKTILIILAVLAVMVLLCFIFRDTPFVKALLETLGNVATAFDKVFGGANAAADFRSCKGSFDAYVAHVSLQGGVVEPGVVFTYGGRIIRENELWGNWFVYYEQTLTEFNNVSDYIGGDVLTFDGQPYICDHIARIDDTHAVIFCFESKLEFEDNGQANIFMGKIITIKDGVLPSVP